MNSKWLRTLTAIILSGSVLAGCATNNGTGIRQPSSDAADSYEVKKDRRLDIIGRSADRP